jgi:hypothetical protein
MCFTVATSLAPGTPRVDNVHMQDAIIFENGLSTPGPMAGIHTGEMSIS